MTATEERTARRDRIVHMVGNAHIDPVWLWRWTEGYQEVIATFRSAVERLEEYDDFVFTADQVVFLAWVEESDPDLFAKIARFVAEGRWQVVGGWWVEPDCNTPHGESFVRQGLYGQRYLHDRFGIVATVGCNVDPFGHAATLPQILSRQRMTRYCFMRPGPHENELPPSVFWWESPDGSRVLTYRIAHEYCSPRGDIAEHTANALAKLPEGLDEVMVFYGVGNHGGGPTKQNIESIRRLDRGGTFGRLVMSTPEHYFDGIAARLGDELAVWRDELQHHAAGCYSAHSGINAWNRRAEQSLLTAERWAAVGRALVGVDYPRQHLDHAWKQTLFNQFHDILPGTAIEPAYADARDQLGEAAAIAGRVTNRSLQAIARDIDIAADERTQAVVLFNPHPWPFVAAIEVEAGLFEEAAAVIDHDGNELPSQAISGQATMQGTYRKRLAFQSAMPALGHTVCTIVPERQSFVPPGAVRVDATTLENELLRVDIDPSTGWVSSLVDKRSGVDVIAGATRPHTIVSDDGSDTWGHGVVSYVLPGTPFQPSGVRITESGPVRATIRIESSWGSSTLVEELSLRTASDQVEVRVTLDWRERMRLLKLRFPTVIGDPIATFEVPFGHLVRATDGAEEPGQSWVDVSGHVAGTPCGLAVINDSKYAYDVSASDIGITAVRSPAFAWHDPRQLDDEGDFQYQDQGVQTFRYALVPHAGDWRGADLARRAAQLLNPVHAALEGPHPGVLPRRMSHLSGSGGQVIVTAIKGSEDPSDDLIVRAYETTGRPGRLVLDVALLDRRLEADFGANQIRTYRIPADSRRPVIEVDLLEWPLDEAGDDG